MTKNRYCPLLNVHYSVIKDSDHNAFGTTIPYYDWVSFDWSMSILFSSPLDPLSFVGHLRSHYYAIRTESYGLGLYWETVVISIIGTVSHIRNGTVPSTTGHDTSNLPSYTPPQHYSPTRDSFLYAPFKHRPYTEGIIHNISAACNRAGFHCPVVKIREAIRGPFTLADLSSFRAAVVFPYAVLSYYLADLISSAVPLFIPSPRMIVEEKVLIDSKTKDPSYCGKKWEDLPRHPNSTHPYSPEDYDPKAVEYWLQFAMFYTPCSIVFDSYDELARLMQTTNYAKVYECNLLYREKVKEHNDLEWKRLFAQIQRNRVFPSSVQSALDWFETDSFFYRVCYEYHW